MYCFLYNLQLLLEHNTADLLSQNNFSGLSIPYKMHTCDKIL